jgi:hypothetical protein
VIHVYGLTDGETVRYIGLTAQTLALRFRAHLTDRGHGAEKRAWMTDVRAAGGKIDIIALDHAEVEEDAVWLERLWITVYRMCGVPLTNATYGGAGLLFPTAETREKLRVSHLGKPRPGGAAATAAQRAKMIGRKKPTGFDAGWSSLSPEQRARRLAGFTKHRHDPKSAEHKARLAATKRGQRHTAETRALMSQRHSERWAGYSDAQRAAIGLAANGSSPEARHAKAQKAARARWANLPPNMLGIGV